MPSMRSNALSAASALAIAVLTAAPAPAQTNAPAPQATPAQPAPAPATTPAPGAQANPPATTTKQVSNTANEAKPQYLPPGMIMGPAVMSAYMMEHMCDPRASGFSGWRISRFEHALDLTADQQKKFDDLKTASAKALDTMVSACSTKPVLTPTGQLELMEKRLTAQLDAVKALRGAFDPFYASLTDEQKAHLNASSRGNTWRWEVGDARGRW